MSDDALRLPVSEDGRQQYNNENITSSLVASTTFTTALASRLQNRDEKDDSDLSDLDSEILLPASEDGQEYNDANIASSFIDSTTFTTALASRLQNRDEKVDKLLAEFDSELLILASEDGIQEYNDETIASSLVESTTFTTALASRLQNRHAQDDKDLTDLDKEVLLLALEDIRQRYKLEKEEPSVSEEVEALTGKFKGSKREMIATAAVSTGDGLLFNKSSFARQHRSGYGNQSRELLQYYDCLRGYDSKRIGEGKESSILALFQDRSNGLNYGRQLPFIHPISANVMKRQLGKRDIYRSPVSYLPVSPSGTALHDTSRCKSPQVDRVSQSPQVATSVRIKHTVKMRAGIWGSKPPPRSPSLRIDYKLLSGQSIKDVNFRSCSCERGLLAAKKGRL